MARSVTALEPRPVAGSFRHGACSAVSLRLWIARVAIPLLRIADEGGSPRMCDVYWCSREWFGSASSARVFRGPHGSRLRAGCARRSSGRFESVADASFCSLSSVRSFPAHSKCLKCRNAFRTSPRTLSLPPPLSSRPPAVSPIATTPLSPLGVTVESGVRHVWRVKSPERRPG